MNDGGYGIASLVDTAAVWYPHAWQEVASSRRSVDQDLRASLSVAQSLEGVRQLRSDPGNSRVLVFTASSLSLELEVISDRVVGQIVPPGPGEIHVEAVDGGVVQVEADDVGFFELPDMPYGLVRLRCGTPTGRLVTDWVRL